MKTKIFLTLAVAFVLAIVGIFFLMSEDRSEQRVLQSTYDLSKEYLLLRYRTDNILINAETYPDHAAWDQDMTALIQDWNDHENKVSALEEQATKESAEVAVSFTLVETANAYTAKEITNIYDKAPRFKGISTLAKHLGVDAKKAQLILNQAQDETTAEGWTEAGDTLQNLETSAVVIKDGCKVAGFVGGVILTGGTAGIATAGVLTKATVVVTGVDLALEVTEDGAQIALGDKNKISSFVGDVRTVTEPIANVMTITNIPGSLGTKFGKFDSVMIGLEQFRESAQEGKVIGIDLTNFESHRPFQVIRQTKYPGSVSAAEMEKAEIEAWLESLNKKYVPMSEAEIKEFLTSTSEKSNGAKNMANQTIQEGDQKSGDDHPATQPADSNSLTSNIIGITWKGTLKNVSGGDQKDQETELEFVLNADGTVSSSNFKNWKQVDNRIRLFGEDESKGYYEFKVNKKDLLLTKMLIGDELIQPGEEYLGGVAPWGIMYPASGFPNSDSQTSGGAMPISEFNEMSDDGLFRNIAQVTEKLGEPDVKTTDDKGRTVFVYYDLVEYDSGNLGSVKMSFYGEDDYKSYIEGMGGSWESNKENWDMSGGGIRASEEIRSGNTYKDIYGQ